MTTKLHCKSWFNLADWTSYFAPGYGF